MALFESSLPITQRWAIPKIPRTKQQKMTQHSVPEATIISINHLTLLDFTGKAGHGSIL